MTPERETLQPSVSEEICSARTHAARLRAMAKDEFADVLVVLPGVVHCLERILDHLVVEVNGLPVEAGQARRVLTCEVTQPLEDLIEALRVVRRRVLIQSLWESAT